MRGTIGIDLYLLNNTLNVHRRGYSQRGIGKTVQKQKQLVLQELIKKRENVSTTSLFHVLQEYKKFPLIDL